MCIVILYSDYICFCFFWLCVFGVVVGVCVGGGGGGVFGGGCGVCWVCVGGRFMGGAFALLDNLYIYI